MDDRPSRPQSRQDRQHHQQRQKMGDSLQHDGAEPKVSQRGGQAEQQDGNQDRRCRSPDLVAGDRTNHALVIWSHSQTFD